MGSTVVILRLFLNAPEGLWTMYVLLFFSRLHGYASTNQLAPKAKECFLKHLATVDTSNGTVTEEIIKTHLVPDMRKSFSKFVKEYGCT